MQRPYTGGSKCSLGGSICVSLRRASRHRSKMYGRHLDGRRDVELAAASAVTVLTEYELLLAAVSVAYH